MQTGRKMRDNFPPPSFFHKQQRNPALKKTICLKDQSIMNKTATNKNNEPQKQYLLFLPTTKTSLAQSALLQLLKVVQFCKQYSLFLNQHYNK
jgi:hypothetical protein